MAKDNKMKKKIKILIILLVIILILMIPIKVRYKDGGTIEYRAILYKVIIWHKLSDKYSSGYKTGTEFHFFPNNFYSLDYYDDVIPPTLYLKAEGTNKKLKANTGSYCWAKEINIKKKSICADSIDPTEMNYLDFLSLSKNQKITYESIEGKINKIELYQANGNTFEKIKYTSDYYNNFISIPNTIGEYIMVLSFTSSNGNVWYSFKIKIND